jgi:hypothetical protein
MTVSLSTWSSNDGANELSDKGEGGQEGRQLGRECVSVQRRVEYAELLAERGDSLHAAEAGCVIWKYGEWDTVSSTSEKATCIRK